MRDLFRALSFLTILPLGPSSAVEGKVLARSMAFFPLVGFILGLLLALGYYLLSFILPRPLVIWLIIGLLILLTRGLHLDGWADTIDGLACGGTKEKILEVMRDSRIGAFGVISLILLLGAKYLALEQISPHTFIPSVILMTVMGRNSMVITCYRSPYARQGEGLAKPFSENLGFKETALASLSALAIALWLMSFKGAAVFLILGLFSLAYRRFFIRKLGGVTGDILGAANELVEVLCLLLLLILDLSVFKT